MKHRSKRQKTNGDEEADESTSEDANTHVAQDQAPKTLPGPQTKEITREALKAEGWVITEVPEDMRRCRVFETDCIPSPFGLYMDTTYRMLETVEAHCHEGLRLLYNHVRDHSLTPAGLITKVNPISTDGRYSHICGLSLSDENIIPTAYDWPGSDSTAFEIKMSVAPMTTLERWLT